MKEFDESIIDQKDRHDRTLLAKMKHTVDVKSKNRNLKKNH